MGKISSSDDEKKILFVVLVFVSHHAESFGVGDVRCDVSLLVLDHSRRTLVCDALLDSSLCTFVSPAMKTRCNDYLLADNLLHQ